MCSGGGLSICIKDSVYVDEGISGTSLKHRDAFNEMLADAKRGKIDLIITKSVSRFARNVKDFLTAVHELAEHVPPIGVFFESENIFSLVYDL
ncbi:MAG: recombinase family protein [Anaerolineaceae bacterium]|nr:recombinase family protein [Anaerolineaceae bacterium]